MVNGVKIAIGVMAFVVFTVLLSAILAAPVVLAMLGALMPTAFVAYGLMYWDLKDKDIQQLTTVVETMFGRAVSSDLGAKVANRRSPVWLRDAETQCRHTALIAKSAELERSPARHSLQAIAADSRRIIDHLRLDKSLDNGQDVAYQLNQLLVDTNNGARLYSSLLDDESPESRTTRIQFEDETLPSMQRKLEGIQRLAYRSKRAQLQSTIEMADFGPSPVSSDSHPQLDIKGPNLDPD